MSIKIKVYREVPYSAMYLARNSPCSTISESHNKYIQDLNSNLPLEFRKFHKNCRNLHNILREAQSILKEIAAAYTHYAGDSPSQVFNDSTTNKLESILNCDPVFIVLGSSFCAKATIVNSLLNTQLLPHASFSHRWIRISFGITNCFYVGESFEYNDLKNVQNLEAAVPEKYLQISEEGAAGRSQPLLEVQVALPILRDRVKFLISPDSLSLIPLTLYEMLQNELKKVLPILIVAFNDEGLSEENIKELHALREHCPDLPVIFIGASGSWPPRDVTVSGSALGSVSSGIVSPCKVTDKDSTDRHLFALVDQLASLLYLRIENPKKHSLSTQPSCEETVIRTDFIDNLGKLDYLVTFVRRCFQSYLIEAANVLSEAITQSLQHFILSAFDMAREIQVTPLRIQYAQEKEVELYRNLIMTAGQKQKEIKEFIENTILEMRSGLLEKAEKYAYTGVTLTDTDKVRNLSEVRIATSEIHNLVLNELGAAVASQLMSSVHCFREIYIGTLQRCLESLEKNCNTQEPNCLASDALKQILSAAYNLKLNASSNLLNSFLDRLKKLLQSLQFPWNAPPCIDAAWRRRVASEMLDSLNASHLAKSVTVQFQEKVKASHEAFRFAIVSLQDHYSSYLKRTEEQRVSIRKYHAPKLARLALESMSMCDMVRYGMPKLGREIGRGQYGVVFTCESWGGVGPCAVKSVVPPDDKHWNDLAMEFFCTRRIPEHKHIVQLRGSVIDTSYGEGRMPCVLLIMDRLSRDLYSGIRANLQWLERLQIAIDVAEGIRFIHSQALVHRDIKLKNVLLDFTNRAKISDFGFCVPEAMMSGSVVGSPVHMAPELLSGHYDSSVDVYAFGILFWFICAGHVNTPLAFDRFQNKEQLWTSVRRGIRPERLPCFDEKCWQLMEQCWASEPSQRPLLGYVLPQLELIRNDYAGDVEEA